MTLVYSRVRDAAEMVQSLADDLLALWVRVHRALEYNADLNVNWTPATKTFTAANASDTMTSTAHDMANGQKARVTSSGALPAGLAAFTDYWLVGVATNTFQLAATLGGAAINFTTDGTGTLTLWPVPDWVTEAAGNDNLIDKPFGRQDVANAIGSLDQLRNLMTNAAVSQGDHMGNLNKLAGPGV